MIVPDIITVPETGSTNDDLKELAREGAAEGLWLRAERQIKGRGRQGRSWDSPAGNLYASTLVRLRDGDPPAASLALVAGVALWEAVHSNFRHPRESGDPASMGPEQRDSRFRGNDEMLLLKWPNDLLIGPAKLAGILLEREGDAVIIGCGVNLAHHPEGLDRPATSLAAQTTPVPPDDFLRTLAAIFAEWLDRWRAGGLAAILDAWQPRAHPVGTPLTFHEREGRQLSGLFDGLAADGALRLRLADGETRVIHAGDVFLI